MVKFPSTRSLLTILNIITDIVILIIKSDAIITLKYSIRIYLYYIYIHYQLYVHISNNIVHSSFTFADMLIIIYQLILFLG